MPVTEWRDPLCGQIIAGSTRRGAYSLTMSALPLGEGGAGDYGALMLRWLLNRTHGAPGIVALPAGGFRRAKAEITGWAEYVPTPLALSPGLAAAADVDAVAVKDESGRFGLGSFKALGGAYAVGEVVKAELARRGVAGNATTADLLAGRYPVDMTVVCASEGNHGISVAWGARRVGAACRIFVREGLDAGRIKAIEALGATVHRVGATYDDSVRAASATAAEAGWFVVSDTSWPGYTEVPRSVMQGYRVMVDEALDHWTGAAPTHVMIQAGVGGVATAVSVQMRARLGPAPRLVLVEPATAACLLASAEQGAPTPVAGPMATSMTCLACAEPSLLAWQELERAAFAFVAIGDAAASDAVRLLAAEGIASAPSGAAGAAGLLAMAADPEGRAALGLSRQSRVLVFNTEGSAA